MPLLSPNLLLLPMSSWVNKKGYITVTGRTSYSLLEFPLSLTKHMSIFDSSLCLLSLRTYMILNIFGIISTEFVILVLPHQPTLSYLLSLLFLWTVYVGNHHCCMVLARGKGRWSLGLRWSLAEPVFAFSLLLTTQVEQPQMESLLCTQPRS